MRTRFIHSGISILLLFIIVIFSHAVILAQDQDTMPGKQPDKWMFNLPHHGLTSVLLDTVRTTLGNSGQGLLHYDCIILMDQDKMYFYKFRKEEKPIMVKATYTEWELETLEHNLLFINKQYQIQIKKWIKKEKMDLNLGEVIKGFYMKPVF